MIKILVFLFISLSFFACAQIPSVKNGDLVFIVNPSGQGKAIQLATKSKYTHVGIVFIENGTPLVYHAVEPVSVSTLDEFAALSSDGNVVVKSLKNQALLNKAKVNDMLKEAKGALGKHYDVFFSWSDNELYCSEFVWKLYMRNLNLAIGKLRSLKEFDLSAPQVKEIMKHRYGNNIPYNENMISPGDMFDSELLE
jgi:hypothetical protein